MMLSHHRIDRRNGVAYRSQEDIMAIGEKAFELPFESDGRTEVRGTLKTKHDTAKNSIGNIR